MVHSCPANLRIVQFPVRLSEPLLAAEGKTRTRRTATTKEKNEIAELKLAVAEKKESAPGLDTCNEEIPGEEQLSW